MRDQIKQLIYEAVQETVQHTELLDKYNKEKDNFEILGNLDSLDMVSLLVDIESKVQDEFNIDILISADRAMSERGPFSTIKTLLDFVLVLIEEQK
jgi:acyl carrier protein